MLYSSRQDYPRIVGNSVRGVVGYAPGAREVAGLSYAAQSTKHSVALASTKNRDAFSIITIKSKTTACLRLDPEHSTVVLALFIPSLDSRQVQAADAGSAMA